MKIMTFSNKVRISNLFTAWSFIIILLLSVSFGFISVHAYKKETYSRYYEYADTILKLCISHFDGDDIKKCINKNKMSSKMLEGLNEMNSVKENTQIAYAYILYFPNKKDKDDMRYVLYANTQDDRNSGISDSRISSPCGGEYEQNIYDNFYLMQFSDDPKSLSAYIVNDYRGVGDHEKVMTVYRPIFDSDGRRVAVAGADIYMSIVSSHIKNHLKKITVSGIILFIVSQIGLIKIIQKNIITPIIALAASTRSFIKQSFEIKEPKELVFSSVPVKLNTEIRDLSDGLSEMTDTITNYMINLQEVTAEKERIGTELYVASQIQTNMLPNIFPAFPERKEFDIYASMTPANEVGGDFYDFFFVDSDHIALVMADVSGKGVPAALFMVIVKTLIKNRAQMGGSPSEILSSVNNQLCAENDAGFFVTVWLAIIEISSGKGLAVNAGHEYPAIRRADKPYKLIINKHSPAVAVMENTEFEEHEFTLERGDSIYVYTDGVAEATNSNNELFGTERMICALNRNADSSQSELLYSLKREIDEFVGNAPQFDDITMMSFLYFGTEVSENE